MSQVHRFWLLLLFVVANSASGCTYGGLLDPFENLATGTGTPPTGTLPDMAPAPPLCPAARGVGGENLLCADFTNDQLTPLGLMEQGWTFSPVSGACPGWETSAGVLQVKDFMNLIQGSCYLTLPRMQPAQIQKYRRLTLSLVQRIDLLSPEQQARIFLDSVSDPENELWRQSGGKKVPRQQTTITLDSADLPSTLQSKGFNWLLLLESGTRVGRNGWQIESIAVHGSP